MSIRKSTIIEKAQRLVLKGKINEAIEEWEKLAAETPNDGNIYNAIGDLHLKANNKADATIAYIKAGEAFHSAAFELKSIALYKKALKVDSSKYEVYEKLAAVYAERGLIGNAIDDYLKAAKHYAESQDFSAALNIYQKLSELDPNNVKVRVEIGEICLKLEMHQEAIEAYKKALSIYESKNKTDEADKIQKIIQELEPASDHEEVKEAVGEPVSKQNQDQDEEGTSLISDEQMQNDPVFDEAPRSESKDNSEEPDESMQEFIAPESEPMVEEQTYFQSDYSVMDFQDVGNIGTEDQNSDTLENVMTEVEVYLQYGLFDKAIDQLKSTIEAFPSEPGPHLKIKEVYTQQGMTDKAIETCRTLMDLYEAQSDAAGLEKIREELQTLLPKKGRTSPTDEVEETEETQLSQPAQKRDETSLSADTTLTPSSTNLENAFGDEISVDESLTDFPSEPTIVGLDEVSKTETSAAPPHSNSLEENKRENNSSLDEHPQEEYVDLNEILSESFSSEDDDELDPSFRESFKSQEDGREDRKEQEAETQYDLGIAYKEMEMISEAMSAFEQAAVGERYEGAMIMLAFCHRDEGSISSAIEVLEKALSDPIHKEKDMVALKYELALLYEQTGDGKFARLFKEIYEIDPNFRDISSKYTAVSLQKNKASSPL